ncbi:acyl carrier protein [Amycolatopsis sp. cg9]|uniref:acyl carrier protein n=1 Tax=Amycolatopsis sp. cg9 TaxID=3238801 RepID=UPI003524EC39
MSTTEEIAAFVKSVLEGFLDEDIEGAVGWDTPIGEGGLGVESIGLLEIVVHLEREYDVSLSDELIERMVTATFGGLVDEVHALVQDTQESERRVA